MPKQNNPKHRGKTALRLGVVCLAFAFVVALNGIVDAKYVKQQAENPAVVAKAFYFESDLLKADSTPTYTLPAGATEISFTLKNYADKLRWSDSKVKYTVSLTGAMTRTVNGEFAEIKCTDNTVCFTGLSAGTYTVTATSSSPYSATLQAKFVIPPADSFDYSAADGKGSPIVRLTVSTGSYSGNITIRWPDGLLPDNTDALLSTATGNSAVVTFSQAAEYTFIFFKTNHQTVYTDSDFTVTTGGSK